MIYDLISHLIHSLFSEVAKKVEAKTEEKELNAKTKLQLARLFKV